MSSEPSSPDAMVQWYRDRIAEPTTNDEVYGYWVFVFGILLGILGILLFLTSDVTTATTTGKAGIALAAVSLVLLMIGPVIRLPLQRAANLVSYAGGFVALLGVAGFMVAYPGWRDSGLAVPVISLFAFGLVLIAVGAALVPVIGGTRRVPAAEGDATAAEPAASTAAESDPATDPDDPGETTAAAATEEPEPEPVAETAESKARFEVFEDRGGKWRWRLRHRNGNIIADSAQGYSSRQKAEQGLESVRTNAAGAAAVREEVEVEPEEEPADAPYPPGESQGTFEVYEDAAGEYRWRLVHRNGNIVADGGEGYADRDAVEDAVERVREYVGEADYLRVDPTAFEVYRDAADEWRWRLIHRNGEILADGGEGYASRTNAQDGVERVRETAADRDAFEVFEDAAGEYRWRLVASNDEIIADGGQGFASERGARDSIERVREYVDEATALDYSDAAFEVFEDSAGEFRWRLRHENGQILGDSGQGYASRTGAIEGLRSVKRNAPNADLTDLQASDESDADASDDADDDEE
ncbi:HVO_2922 family protein [Halosimplex halophilum]|uniref:HVO_2922 family protein n=1 Tax=Halosimplex halophilum TaxID=2559572 RepID=UPI00143544AA|nr:HVO_2922 family protein [Halosimplex halophilum]